MGYIDYCSQCQYAYTKDCNYGSKECNQEKARILLENSARLVDKVYNKSGICVNKNPISLSDDKPIKG